MISRSASGGIESACLSGSDSSEQMIRARNARTLGLRRTDGLRPKISSLATRSGCNVSLNLCPLPVVELSSAISALKSGNVEALYGDVLRVSRTNPRALACLFQSSEFVEALAEAIGAGYGVAATQQVIELSQVVFPMCGSLQNEFVDAGVCIYLNDFLRGEASLAQSVIGLICVLSENSEYARNALMCMGVHESLIEIAKEQISGELTIGCCQGLLVMFKRSGTIESEYLVEAARSMVPLLSIESCEVVTIVIRCFVEMSNSHNEFSNLVFVFYDLGLFSMVVGFLDNPKLVGAAIRLVGNLCVAEPAQIRDMLEAGLLQKVLYLLDSEYAADAFWVLSNLLERMQNEILAVINDAFVKRVTDVIELSSYDIQREASFFLATLILFSTESSIGHYLNSEVAEPLVQMLECGNEKTQLRCLEALIKISKYAMTSAGDDARAMFAGLLLENDVKNRLENIIEAQKFSEQATIFEQLYEHLLETQ